MKFAFLAVRRLASGTEVVESRVLCADLTEALSIFRPEKDRFIVSEASYAAGLPKPLGSGICKSCGQRPATLAYRHSTGRYGPCQARIHVEQQGRTVSKRNPYPTRTYSVSRKRKPETPIPPGLLAGTTCGIAS